MSRGLPRYGPLTQGAGDVIWGRAQAAPLRGGAGDLLPQLRADEIHPPQQLQHGSLIGRPGRADQHAVVRPTSRVAATTSRGPPPGGGRAAYAVARDGHSDAGRTPGEAPVGAPPAGPGTAPQAPCSWCAAAVLQRREGERGLRRGHRGLRECSPSGGGAGGEGGGAPGGAGGRLVAPLGPMGATRRDVGLRGCAVCVGQGCPGVADPYAVVLEPRRLAVAGLVGALRSDGGGPPDQHGGEGARCR